MENVSFAPYAPQSQDVCAAHVRMLFYGNGPFGELPGSLLEQLAQYIINGIEHTFKLAGMQQCTTLALFRCVKLETISKVLNLQVHDSAST